MRGARRGLVACVIVLLLVMPKAAFAVQPDEVLGNAKLEARARDISANLRCLVCQNQSIDDSDAPLARDLRLLVRDRLKAGDTNSEVVDFVVARYGEFVLLKPRMKPSTWILWFTPVIVLLLGGSALFFAYGRTRQAAESNGESLSAEERAALDDVLKRQ